MRLPLRDSGETAAVYALVPLFYLSFYLLLFYRSNGSNPDLFQYGYETAVILAVLLGIYAAVAGRFEKARPRFRAACCGLGLLMIVQELVFLVLAPGQVLPIPASPPLQPSCWLHLPCCCVSACAILRCGRSFPLWKRMTQKKMRIPSPKKNKKRSRALRHGIF
jgi:hypothetical protein